MAVRLIDLFFLGRPLLMIPVWTVYLHTLSLIGHSTAQTFLPGQRTLIDLAVLTLICTGGYVLNQIYDIETDRLNDKLFFLPRGIIPIRIAWIVYFLTTLIGLIIAYVGSPHLFLPALMIAIMGFLYSAPYIKLKDRPVWGLLSNAFVYGIIIPCMPILSYGRFENHLFLIAPYFLAIATGYTLTTIPDYDGDATAGKRTLAVILTPKGALWLALLFALGTLLMSIATENHEMAIVSGLTLLLIIYLSARFDYKLIIFTCKFPVLLLTIFAGWHYPFYVALLFLTIVLTRSYYKRRFGIVYPKLI